MKTVLPKEKKKPSEKSTADSFIFNIRIYEVYCTVTPAIVKYLLFFFLNMPFQFSFGDQSCEVLRGGRYRECIVECRGAVGWFIPAVFISLCSILFPFPVHYDRVPLPRAHVCVHHSRVCAHQAHVRALLFPPIKA